MAAPRPAHDSDTSSTGAALRPARRAADSGSRSRSSPPAAAQPRRFALSVTEYQLDDGVAENAIGTGNEGTVITWYQWYDVIPGNTVLLTVNVEAGFAAGDCNGLPVTVAVLDDPDGDGDPFDAEVIETGSGVLGPGGPPWSTAMIALDSNVDLAATVTNPNGRFFIAAEVTQVVAAGCDFPATIDFSTQVPGRSYIGIGALASCPDQGGGGGPGCPVDCATENCGVGIAGTWLLRATSLSDPCGDVCVPQAHLCSCQPPFGNCPVDPDESGAAECTDGLDNDCDGDPDCDDAGCAAEPNCIDCIVDCGAPSEGGQAVVCPGGTGNAEPVCTATGQDPDNFNGGCNSNGGTVYSCNLDIDGPVVCGTSGRYTENCLVDADCPTNAVCAAGPGDSAACPGTTPSSCVCRLDCTLPGGAECGGEGAAAGTCEDEATDRCTGGETPVRDTDWYLFEVPAGQFPSIELRVTASFGALIGFVDDAGGANCAAAAFIESQVGDQCTQASGPITTVVTACLGPGLYTAFVAPSSADVDVACGSEYSIELNEVDTCVEPFCAACDASITSDGDLACQTPDQQGHGMPPDDGIVALNSTSTVRVADTFAALVPGGFNRTCWWGTYVDFSGTPAPCEEGDFPSDFFTITYFQNDDADVLPGNIIAFFNAAPVVRTLTGGLIGSGAGNLIEVCYSATHAVVDIPSTNCHWLEIQNLLDENGCTWLWETAGGGDSIAAQDEDGDGYQPGVASLNPLGDHVLTDLAWCLGRIGGSPEIVVAPGACQLIGGCCDDAGAACENDVDVVDCLSSNRRFGLDQDCPLEPPCGSDCVDFTDCGDVNNDSLRDDPCAWYACTAGECSDIPRGTGNQGQFGQADMGGAFGNCLIDGVADGNDVFHALRCFSNQDFRGAPGYPCEDNAPPPPQVPQAFNVDAGSNASCGLDGACDGNDAFHALRSFSNTNFVGGPGYPCTCSGPAPSHADPVEPGEWTGLTLRAPRAARPGDLVDVDVYVDDDLKALTGYQLHIGASGGNSAPLELVDISVDTERGEYVYAGVEGTWSAYNRSIGQMVVGMNTLEGTPARAEAYLATFTYRVPKGASGTYVVEVLHGPSASPTENRTFLFGYSSGPIGLRAAAPVAVEVSDPR
jgi:hypothetical protein